MRLVIDKDLTLPRDLELFNGKIKTFVFTRESPCQPNALTEYISLDFNKDILKNIPAYEQANTQRNQASQQYQSEVEAKAKEAETLYKEYQKASASLSAAQKTQREEAIVALSLIHISAKVWPRRAAISSNRRAFPTLSSVT